MFEEARQSKRRGILQSFFELCALESELLAIDHLDLKKRNAREAAPNKIT